MRVDPDGGRDHLPGAGCEPDGLPRVAAHEPDGRRRGEGRGEGDRPQCADHGADDRQRPQDAGLGVGGLSDRRSLGEVQIPSVQESATQVRTPCRSQQFRACLPLYERPSREGPTTRLCHRDQSRLPPGGYLPPWHRQATACRSGLPSVRGRQRHAKSKCRHHGYW